MDHYEHLMTERMKYTWISSANKAGAAEPIKKVGGYVLVFFQFFCIFLCFGVEISLFLMSERKKFLRVKTKAVVVLIILVKRLCPEMVLPFTTKVWIFMKLFF